MPKTKKPIKYKYEGEADATSFLKIKPTVKFPGISLNVLRAMKLLKAYGYKDNLHETLVTGGARDFTHSMGIYYYSDSFDFENKKHKKALIDHLNKNGAKLKDDATRSDVNEWASKNKDLLIKLAEKQKDEGTKLIGGEKSEPFPKAVVTSKHLGADALDFKHGGKLWKFLYGNCMSHDCELTEKGAKWIKDTGIKPHPHKEEDDRHLHMTFTSNFDKKAVIAQLNKDNPDVDHSNFFDETKDVFNENSQSGGLGTIIFDARSVLKIKEMEMSDEFNALTEHEQNILRREAESELIRLGDVLTDDMSEIERKNAISAHADSLLDFGYQAEKDAPIDMEALKEKYGEEDLASFDGTEQAHIKRTAIRQLLDEGAFKGITEDKELSDEEKLEKKQNLIKQRMYENANEVVRSPETRSDFSKEALESEKKVKEESEARQKEISELEKDTLDIGRDLDTEKISKNVGSYDTWAIFNASGDKVNEGENINIGGKNYIFKDGDFQENGEAVEVTDEPTQEVPITEEEEKPSIDDPITDEERRIAREQLRKDLGRKLYNEAKKDGTLDELIDTRVMSNREFDADEEETVPVAEKAIPEEEEDTETVDTFGPGVNYNVQIGAFKDDKITEEQKNLIKSIEEKGYTVNKVLVEGDLYQYIVTADNEEDMNRITSDIQSVPGAENAFGFATKDGERIKVKDARMFLTDSEIVGTNDDGLSVNKHGVPVFDGWANIPTDFDESKYPNIVLKDDDGSYKNIDTSTYRETDQFGRALSEIPKDERKRIERNIRKNIGRRKWNSLEAEEKASLVIDEYRRTVAEIPESGEELYNAIATTQVGEDVTWTPKDQANWEEVRKQLEEKGYKLRIDDSDQEGRKNIYIEHDGNFNTWNSDIVPILQQAAPGIGDKDVYLKSDFEVNGIEVTEEDYLIALDENQKITRERQDLDYISRNPDKFTYDPITDRYYRKFSRSEMRKQKRTDENQNIKGSWERRLDDDGNKYWVRVLSDQDQQLLDQNPFSFSDTDNYENWNTRALQRDSEGNLIYLWDKESESFSYDPLTTWSDLIGKPGYYVNKDGDQFRLDEFGKVWARKRSVEEPDTYGDWEQVESPSALSELGVNLEGLAGYEASKKVRKGAFDLRSGEGASNLIAAVLGTKGLADAMKKIDPKEMPSLSSAFEERLRQSEELAKQGFSPAEEASIRNDINSAYLAGVENLVRGTAGDRAKFLASSGVLDANRSTALLDFAAKDAEQRRVNRQEYTNLLSYKENFEAQKTLQERQEDLDEQLANKAAGADLAANAFSSIRDSIQNAPVRNLMRLKVKQMSDEMFTEDGGGRSIQEFEEELGGIGYKIEGGKLVPVTGEEESE